jgi:tetratricopeptide (TPR) repeat protein
LSVHALPALDREQTREVLLELLAPVQFVPEDLVAQLCRLTQGVPLSVVEITQALRRAGAIRRHPGASGWYVAADELLRTSETPLAERLAARAEASLPPMLLALLRLCALLGQELWCRDVEGVQELLENDGGGEAMADAQVGTQALLQDGWLQRAGSGQLQFRDRLVREAVERSVPGELARTVQAAIFRWLTPQAGDPLASARRRAPHAAAAGLWREAAELYLLVAEHMRLRHQYIDAEQLYSAALSLLPGDHELELPVLAGRGRIRYRSERMEDALVDLRRACQLAEARGDQALSIDLILEQATVLDWLGDYRGSAALVERVSTLVGDGADARLRARVRMARGRSQLRAQDLERCLSTLEEAAAEAARAGEYEAEVIALLLLAAALAYARQIERSKACFDRVIARCEQAGDRLHRAGALNNRIHLWIQLGNYDAAVDDARNAIRLTREIGNSSIERRTVDALAHLLYWTGSLDEAKRRAAEAHRLSSLSSQLPGVAHALLMARICVARDEPVEAGERLQWALAHAGAEPLSPIHKLFVAALQALYSPQLPLASPTEEELRLLMVDEARELLWLHCRTAGARGEHDRLASLLARARQLAAGAPAWAARFDALATETSVS